MSSRWTLIASLAVPLATIACGGGAAVASNGPPTTPVVALPPAWTPTVAPALTLPEGWKPLIGAGVELWLPGSFEGGDPATRREELIEVFRGLGPDYEDIVAALESGAPSLVFMAFDTGLAGAIVGITRHDLPASVGLAEYVEAYVAEQPSLIPGLVVLESGTMSLAGEEVGKGKLDITTQGATSTQVSYFFHRGDFVYTVSYAVPKEYFAEAEPAFEASIGSFRVTQ
jgi:hypothetical protein